MNKHDGNIAFKCTWNDAGFKGICSNSAYEYNISKNRVWCKKAPCRTFEGIPNNIDHPCYESILFSEWRFGAGWDHRIVERPRNIKYARSGKIALLTTLPPDRDEREREIIGFFKINRIEEGELKETVIYGDPEMSLEIDPGVNIRFWNYYKNPNAPDRCVWGTGLFRYLNNQMIFDFLGELKRIYTERDFSEKTVSKIEKNLRNYDSKTTPDLTPSAPQEERKPCLRCKHLNPEQARFCTKCGQPFRFQCSRCQTQNPAGSNYCFECGAELGDNPPGDSHAVKDRLIEFGRLQLNEPKDWLFVRHKEADKLVRENANAFLFGVILDQGIDAEKAWAAPHELKMRIGHLNPENIANMPLRELEGHFSEGIKLHRFWPTMARRIRAACGLITTNYGGDAKNIWSDEPDSRTLYKRLIEFDGIGQKKASMAVNILYRDLNIAISDPSGIDVSYDEMVRRVFFRTGLVERDTMNDVIKAARNLNPEYPGELDHPTWIIGRKWCLPKNPKCAECYLGDICPKIDIPGFL